jgi:hypothetical protein
MKHYIKLDWPAIPEELEAELITFANSATTIWKGANPNSKAGYNQFDTTTSFKYWAYATLPIQPTSKIIMQQYYGITQGNKHVDKIRNSTHNYLLLPNNARTSWYDDAGNLLDSVQYSIRTWYWHDSSTPHQVTNIDSVRLAVSIYESIV